jgi:DNA-binding transcriptional regulator YiaG
VVESHVVLDPIVHTSGDLAAIDDEQSSSADIMELRRLSGLTWDQLGRLFQVARRTVHFWASGKALNAVNQEKLYRILETVREIDKGGAAANLATLFSSPRAGVTHFDLLRDGRYAEVIASIGEGEGYRIPTLRPISSDARMLRAPSVRPEDLADALQDTIHRNVGRSRVARVARTKRTNRGSGS